jgi:endonuclease-8
MPEGDTIHRAARTIAKAIGGRVITRFETVVAALARANDQQPIVGRRIDAVTARGKNLIIAFSGGLFLRSHLRMNGSWHIYRPGEAWMKRRSDMRVVIATDDFVVVGFNLPIAEFHDARSLEREPDLQRLGPDLVADDFDPAEALRRIRRYPDREIADVLLNQGALAGIGNIYKSEVLFLCGISPFALVSSVADGELERVIAIARKLLVHNVERAGGSRETMSSLRQSQRLWVYGRRGEPCRKCGTRIEYRKQGPDVRGTYWCPRCQTRHEA